MQHVFYNLKLKFQNIKTNIFLETQAGITSEKALCNYSDIYDKKLGSRFSEGSTNAYTFLNNHNFQNIYFDQNYANFDSSELILRLKDNNSQQLSMDSILEFLCLQNEYFLMLLEVQKNTQTIKTIQDLTTLFLSSGAMETFLKQGEKMYEEHRN